MYLSPSSAGLPGSGRRGAVAVFVAVCLTVLLAIVALALDGGMLLSERRHAQAVADAAARAAAIDLYLGNSISTAQQSALSTAAANGYTNDGSTSIITPNARDSNGNPMHGIWIPPISGDSVGDTNCAEVVVQWNQPRSFSNIFGSGVIPVRARAVATGLPTAQTGAGVVLLDPTGAGALNLAGSSSVTCNAKVIVNSSNTQAVTGSGSESLTAPVIDITGNRSSTATLNGTVNTGVTPTSDPLTSLSPPDPSTLPVQSSGYLWIHGQTTQTLSPGRYIGGIRLGGSSNVTLEPGIYYIDGGGFTIIHGANVTGNGVLIYNEPQSSSDQISINGSGNVNLSPPTTGPYAGITLFQDRTSSVAANIGGGSSYNLSGTFYLAGAPVTVTGAGGTALLGSQYICHDLTLKGSGTIQITWDAKLVARKTGITLVE